MASATKKISSTTPEQLGTSKISRLLVQYSVPAIVASLVTSLYNIIDSIFIGRGVGAMAIAGLAITFPLMNLVAAFITLIAAGGATISSIFLGQKNKGRATDTINNVLTLCITNSLVFGTLALVFLDPILYFFGATDDTIPYAREFMEIILYGTPISFVFIGLNNLMRATGYPRKAMVSALLSVAVNIVVAPLLIFEFDWGIKGAALATICGQTTALAWVVLHFCSPKSFIHFKRGNRWFSPGIVKRIYAIGLSPFLMNVCSCVIVILINKALLDYGGDMRNMQVASYGILNRLIMCFVMIVFGITQGMQPILGYNYGAGNWSRVKRTLKIGIWAGVAITVAGAILGQLFPKQIASLFTSDTTLINLTENTFRLYFIFFPFVGAQVVITNFFQSIGKPKISIFLSLTRQLLFVVPQLIILPRLWGTDGVWLSLTFSDGIAFVVAIATLAIELYRHGRRLKENQLVDSIPLPHNKSTQQ